MAKGKWQFLHRSDEYIFYYRRAIPDSIRHAFGNRWEIKRSLKTRDKSIAILRHNDLNMTVERLFMQAKVGGDMGKDLTSMLARLEDRKGFLAETESGARWALWSGITSLLRGKPVLDGNNKIVRPAQVSVEGDKLIDAEGKIIPAIEISIALSIADKQESPVIMEEAEKHLDAFRGFHFFEMKDGSFSPITPLPKKQAEVIAHEAAVQAPPQNIPQPVESQQPRNDGVTSVRFSVMTEDYLQDRPTLKPKTKEDFRGIFRVFLDLEGDVLSTDISHQLMSAFKRKLQQLPANATKKYPHSTLRQLLDMDIPEDELMSPVNVNKYLSRLSQLFKWAVNEGYMTQNYAAGKSVLLSKKAKKKHKRFPFSMEDLKGIFNNTVHAENKRDGRYTEIFWVPLIALYSGMRMEEICQLQVEDVKEIVDDRNGARVWCFDANENGHHKSLKNLSSERLIPIHSELIKMGFMDYYQTRRRKGFQTLWNLEPAKSGATVRGYSHNLGKRLNRYLKKAGVNEEGKSFHSFRHTAIKALRENPDIREDYMKALVGHELSGTTGKDYFAGLGVVMLKSTVEGIGYPRLNLCHLYADE